MSLDNPKDIHFIKVMKNNKFQYVQLERVTKRSNSILPILGILVIIPVGVALLHLLMR